MARKRMLACDTPQYSAHWPMYSPGTSGVRTMRFTRPGTTSRLPPSCGIQNEWITSGPCRWNATVWPTGQMDLVGGDDLEAGIPEVPPPLLAGDVDVQRRRRRRFLRLEDDADRRDADDDEDHREGDRPRDLQHRVPVDLLGNGRARPLAEAPARVEQPGLHGDEDAEGPPRDQHEDVVGHPPEVRLRDDRGHLRIPVPPDESAAGAAHDHGEEEHRQGEARWLGHDLP